MTDKAKQLFAQIPQCHIKSMTVAGQTKISAKSPKVQGEFVGDDMEDVLNSLYLAYQKERLLPALVESTKP